MSVHKKDIPNIQPVAYLVKNRITSHQRLMFGDGPLLSETAEPLYLEETVSKLQESVADMLEALRDCEQNMIISTVADMARLGRVRAAIAKATGETL